jgi:hypothetical protein
MNDFKYEVLWIAGIGYSLFFFYLLFTGKLPWFLGVLKRDIKGFFRAMSIVLSGGIVIVNESQRQIEDKQD